MAPPSLESLSCCYCLLLRGKDMSCALVRELKSRRSPCDTLVPDRRSRKGTSCDTLAPDLKARKGICDTLAHDLRARKGTCDTLASDWREGKDTYHSWK